jgi:hypothetical protein
MHNQANLITDHADGIDLECGEWSLINALRPADMRREMGMTAPSAMRADQSDRH